MWVTRDVRYADEDGLLKGGTIWWRLNGKENPSCGNGVVVGARGSWRRMAGGYRNRDPVITIEEVAAE